MGDLTDSKLKEYEAVSLNIVDMVLVESKQQQESPGSYNYFQELIIKTFNLQIADQIFRKLCDQSMYQKTNNCTVCKKQFGMMKGTKNCKFCGCTVCEECSPKKRCNPNNRTQFMRICDICDEKYLRAFLSSDFKQQTKLLKDKTTRLEKETAQYKNTLNEKNQEHQKEQRQVNQLISLAFQITYNMKKDELDTALAKEENQLNKQIQKLNNTKKEIIEIDEQIQKIRNLKATNEENITDNISKLQQSQNQLEHVKTEIERITSKQKNTQDELATMNQNVTSYQLNNRKGMDSILGQKIKPKIQGFGGNRFTKESTLTNQGYDDVFRSQNNNFDSVEDYLIGMPQQNSSENN